MLGDWESFRVPKQVYLKQCTALMQLCQPDDAFCSYNSLEEKKWPCLYKEPLHQCRSMPVRAIFLYQENHTPIGVVIQHIH